MPGNRYHIECSTQRRAIGRSEGYVACMNTLIEYKFEKLKVGKRIIIAGGGTGGHIFPAIAIANALKQIDETTEILFVGAKGKMEMEKVPQAGYRIEGLDIAGFNRSSLMKNIGLPFKLVKSFLQVRKIIREFA